MRNPERKEAARGMSASNNKPKPFDAATFVTALEAAVRVAFAQSPLPAKRLACLIKYGFLLAEASQTINLTRILDPEAMAVRHFLDAFQLLPMLKEVRGPIVDVGTGGGVPGIPLAIFRRDLRVVMIDGTAKKIHYVAEWIDALKLKNAAAVAERAEAHLKTNRYHTLICRASVKPPAMMEILAQTGPAAKRLIFMEGAQIKERVRNTLSLAKRAGYVFDVARPYRLPGLDRERHLLCYRRK